MANYKNGDKVYWNDPDNGECSGEYEILEVKEEIYVLKNKDGSTVEVFENELGVLLEWKDIEVGERSTVNYQKRIVIVSDREPFPLMQIDGVLQLWHTDKTGNPTRPSCYWLTKAIDFE